MSTEYVPCRYCGSTEHISSEHQFDTSRVTRPVHSLMDRIRGR